MTELLILSLCELLPHKTICKDCETNFIGTLGQVDVGFGIVGIKGTNISTVGRIPYCKPYLFPLSSMTEEQEIIYGDFVYGIVSSNPLETQKRINELYDWLNKNHFDWRGLIPMGLAIDATINNPYK